MECLKEHLLHITNDSALKEKEVKQPRCLLPARKTLPTLGARTVDIRTKDEEDRETNGQMRLRTDELRLKLIDNGRRDEMKLRQPIGAPDVKEGTRMQCMFVHKDDNANEDSAEWCTGTIVRVSNGKNLETPIPTGPKYYRKGGAAEVRWDANLDNGESESYAIVTMHKTLFNVYKVNGWRLFFDIPWSHKPLGSAIRNEGDNSNDIETIADTSYE